MTLPARSSDAAVPTVTATVGPARSAEIRATYHRFPRWSQGFWTWFTGVPAAGQSPWLRLTPITYLICDLLAMAAGIGGAWFVVSKGFGMAWLSLPLWWALTVSAARVCSTVIAHHAIHVRFTGRIRTDRLVHQVLSTLVCTDDADQYFEDHIKLHHRKETFATLADPTIQHLLWLGFRPGTPQRRLWRRLAWTIVSPRFHGQFLWTRLGQNLWRCAPYRAVMGAVYLSTVVGLVAWSGTWTEFALAVVIPMLPLYHVVALLEFLSEHAWFKAKDESLSGRAFHVSHSWGRFSGDPVPSAAGSGAWSRWLVRFFLYHLPSRLLVVPGDLAQHDFHHRRPSTKEWVRAAYARQADIDRKHPGWPPYSEVWGIAPAIGQVFAILSEEQPLDWVGEH